MMVHKKVIFFIAMGLIGISSTSASAMTIHKSANKKYTMTSFLLFEQLYARIFTKTGDQIKKEIIDNIEELKIDIRNIFDSFTRNPISQQNVDTIKTKWLQICHLHVSNAWERLLNPYGPPMIRLTNKADDSEKPFYRELAIKIHPDKTKDMPNADLYVDLFKYLSNTVEPRQNPLTSAEFINYSNDKINAVKNLVENKQNQEQFIAMLQHDKQMVCGKETLACKREVNELAKADAQVFCDTFVKKIEIDGYLRKKKKGQ